MKNPIGAKNLLSPFPAVLVGVNVNGKPTYMTVAHCGVAALIHISISVRKGRFTSIGIKENGTFSVNLPTAALVKETDYCGLFSGNQADKSVIFESFYGTLGTAPMIKQCPINMECRLKQTVDFPTHEVFIGEVVQSYCEDNCFKDSVLDIAQLQLLIYGAGKYWKIGEPVAKAFEVGKELQEKNGEG
jgi:flavin reductase (DIM6/NTAB) family NADH-FMN oxidoreductase RutF